MSFLSRLPRAWKHAGMVVGGWLVCELVARFALPMPDAQVLAAHFAKDGAGLLRLYDWAVSGALSKGSILALGVMPYFTARTYRYLVRFTSARIASLERSVTGRRTLARWTLGMTGAFSVMQAAGFAIYTMGIGAAHRPGIGYFLQTVAVLGGVATFLGYICQQVTEGETEEASLLSANAPSELPSPMNINAGVPLRVQTPVP